MLKRCERCLMPDTRPGAIFTDGVCQACLNYDKRAWIDWEDRKEELVRICSQCKSNSQYECVVAVSGGKDSHALTHLMVQEMGLKTLLVYVADHFTHTAAGKHNLENLARVFDCDLLTYTIPFSIFRASTRQDFEQLGHPLRFIESLIYAVPASIAYQMRIPLLVFGEDSYYEYGTRSAETNPYLHIKKCLEGLDDSIRHRWHNDMPSRTRAIYGSHYMPWDGFSNYQLAKRYGFRSLEQEWCRAGYLEDYDQIDSIGYLVHLWMKYPKFGFGRQTDVLSRWIRRGRIGWPEALDLANEGDPVLDPRALDDFCSTLGYKTADFWHIVEEFYDPRIFEKRRGLWYMR